MASKKELRLEELSALTQLMRNRAGRRWMYNILANCHVYHTSFDKNALVMAHLEGERNAGLMLITELKALEPDLYIQMLRDAAEDERSSSSATRRLDGDASSPGDSTDAESDPGFTI